MQIELPEVAPVPSPTLQRIDAFFDRTPKLWIALAATLVHGVLYMVPNHLQLAPVHALPMSTVDLGIPFWPWTGWIYWSDYVLVFVAFQRCVHPGSARHFATALFATIVVGTLVHWVYPTVYPRELFPLPSHGVDPVTHWVFERFRRLDSAASCMPSLHVASSFVGVFAVATWESWRRAWPLALWATAIAASTLTTKQHYASDVFAGIALAALVVWLLRPRLPLPARPTGGTRPGGSSSR